MVEIAAVVVGIGFVVILAFLVGLASIGWLTDFDDCPSWLAGLKAVGFLLLCSAIIGSCVVKGVVF